MATPSKINHCCFNSQQDAFCVAAACGIRIFNTNPLVLLKALENDVTGRARIGTVLHRSNVFVFVGAGSSTKYSNNTALIYDTKQKEIVFEVTVPGGPILNVLLSYSRLIIVQKTKIHIFAFGNNCRLIRSEDIRANPTGLASLSSNNDGSGQMLAYPGFKVGSVRIMDVTAVTEKESISPNSIDAHLSEVAELAVNNQGTLLATGSIKGTVIRVFDIRTRRCLLECRRGSDNCTLHCLQFSPCSSFLACSSDKGTIHIFAIRENDHAASKQGFLQQVGLVKGEKRSCAQIAIEPKVIGIGFLAATSSTMQSIVAVCEDGTFHR
ncbi:hypothetical protein WR25_07679 isoform B [Diploscapter pachys]|nr:hypothetical protein WR25_07679 isoform B [Diploscapter pachys]